MSVVSDLYAALSIFNVPLKVHPTLNVLDGGKTNALNETVPITQQDMDDDNEVRNVEEPVVPRSSNVSTMIAQSLNGAGSTQPRQLAWYSELELSVGTLVEYKGHTFQIDEIGDYDAFAGVYVYYLRGDDALEQTI